MSNSDFPDPNQEQKMCRMLAILTFIGCAGICFFAFFVIMFFTSCTVNLNNIHNEGVADDLVDETTTPEVSTDLEVPAFKV